MMTFALILFQANPDNFAIAEHHLRRALESIFDIGRHIMAKAGLGHPVDYRSILVTLGQHTAILERALGISAVVALGDHLLDVPEGEIVVLDGDSGTLWINPDSSTLSWTKEQQERYKEERRELDGLRYLEPITTDGWIVRLRVFVIAK